MPKFIISGPAKLKGEIEVKGAKNAALKILPAAILSNEKISICNLPKIEDIDRSIELLKEIGAVVEQEGDGVEIQIKKIKKTLINPKIANKLRASIMFVGPVLSRSGEVKFPHPGGCVIGAGLRPIDYFIDGFRAMGADIKFKNGIYHLRAKRLKGCSYFFPNISVTGTESMMLSGVLAKGKTLLKNCAMEPEIKALADYLNLHGAKISGAGTPTMVIEGVEKIGAGNFRIIPDRIETGTFAIMAAATGSEITIKKCDPAHVEHLLNVFSKIGVRFEAGKDFIKIFPAKKIKPYSIKTHEYPGFPTDLQSPYTVLMTQAEGSSLIHESIYDRRLLFTDMLTQMGANIIMCDPHRVVVNGPSRLIARKLTSPDLRAGIAMIIAAMAAEGSTEIDNIYQIERGYENIDQRLFALGADIRRIDD
jgi:UDP-N-acetylglucosamine 1-carboxyvinyltransferase